MSRSAARAVDQRVRKREERTRPFAVRRWSWLRLVLAGAVLGGIVGVVVGLAFPHWGPLLAVGAFPWVLGLEVGIPLGAVFGALVAMFADGRRFTRAGETQGRRHHGGHGARPPRSR